MAIQWQAIKQYVESLSVADHSGHDWNHIRRVMHLSDFLISKSAQSGLQADIIRVAALTHDVLDEKLVAPDERPIRRQALTTQYQMAGFTSKEIETIYEIIDHMSYSKNLAHHYQLTAEGEIVQDADRLDALGAIGIGRAFYYGAQTKAPMYDAEVGVRTTLNYETYRQRTPVLNHFDEKLFKLAGLMNTPAAKELAERRTALMRQFQAEFIDEWHFFEN